MNQALDTSAPADAEVLDDRNTKWQRIALAMGWRTWNVGATNEEHDLIKAGAKVERKKVTKEKAKETRVKNKEIITALERSMRGNEYLRYKKATKGMAISKRIEYLKKNK